MREDCALHGARALLSSFPVSAVGVNELISVSTMRWIRQIEILVIMYVYHQYWIMNMAELQLINNN